MIFLFRGWFGGVFLFVSWYITNLRLFLPESHSTSFLTYLDLLKLVVELKSVLSAELLYLGI